MLPRSLASTLLFVSLAAPALAQSTTRPALPPESAIDDAKPLEAHAPGTFVERSFPADGLSLRVPADWKPFAGTKPATARLLIVNAAGNVTIALAIGHISAGGTTATALREVRDEIVAMHMREAFLTSDYVRIGPSATPAARLVYELAIGGRVAVRACSLTIVRDGSTVSLTLSAPPKSYDAALPIFEQVASTLKLAPAK